MCANLDRLITMTLTADGGPQIGQRHTAFREHNRIARAIGLLVVLVALAASAGSFLVLTGGSKYLPRLPQLRLGRVQRVHAVALSLGAIFGLSAPVCAAPLLGLLVARSLPLGATGGFVQMFVFGVAMSAPLIGLAAWDGWQRGLQRLSALRRYVPYLTGGALLLIGLYGIASGWRG